jgi:putative ABC transport system permease protein
VQSEAGLVTASTAIDGLEAVSTASPAAGRSFAAGEEQPGHHRVVVIGNGWWRQRFGADPDVVGRDLVIGDERYTIIGVAPPGFDFPVGAQIWAPLALTPERVTDRHERTLTVAAKLASGRSIADAQSEMDVVSRRLAQQYPETNRDREAQVQRLSHAFRDGSATGLFAMLALAAGLVLLVACMNIGGLLLSRTLDRHHELALRSALGATSLRIARQLVTEMVVLALLASVLAFVCVSIGLDLLRASLPAEITRFIDGWNHLRLDWRVAAAIPALALAVGIAVGVVPAITALRRPSTALLREAGRGTSGGGRQIFRRLLVTAEIAFAVALLVAAGLTIAAGARLVNQPGGFEPERLLTLQLPLPPDRAVGSAPSDLADALRERIEALPGIDRVTAANVLPAAGWSPTTHVEIEGMPALDSSSHPRAAYRIVADGYFETLRVPVLLGRSFSTADRKQTQPVAVVSATFAERFLHGQDPIGRRVRLGGGPREWLTIVGVAGDVQTYNWWDGVDATAVYVPLPQTAPPGMLHMAVRTLGEPATTAASVRDAIRAVDSRLLPDQVRTARDAIDESRRSLTWLASLMAICGGLGALLAVVGIYSLMVHVVSQREHEFGVRIALGATPRDVLQVTLRQAAALTIGGAAGGIVLGMLAGRLLSGTLEGLLTVDIRVFAVVVPSLGLVAMAAAYVPARRALRVDPAVVLRS